MTPNEIYHTLQKSDHLYAEQKYNDAKEILENNLQPHAVFYFKIAQCYLALEDLDRAWEWFDKAEKESNYFFEPSEGKAYVKMFKEEYDESAKYFESAKAKLLQNYSTEIPAEELEEKSTFFDAEISFCKIRLGIDNIQFLPGKHNYLTKEHGMTEFNFEERPKKLLVAMNEGIGEQITISQIFREAADDFESLTVRCQGKLVPMFEKTYDSIKFVAQDEGIDHLDYEAVIDMNSFANLYRKKYSDFDKANFPLFEVDKKKVDEFRNRFYDGRPLIGIFWNSPGVDEMFIKKNIPLDVFEPLLKDDRYKFVSLQHGDSAKDIERLGYDIEDRNDIEIFDDLENLFCLVSACDAVVGSSNSSHCVAGSLGIPSFNLSHSGQGRIWMWRIAQNGNSLFLPSVRILETKNGSSDWSVPVAQLIDELSSKFQKGGIRH